MRKWILLAFTALTSLLSAQSQSTAGSGDAYNYYLHRSTAKPLLTNPYKWPGQPVVADWDAMEAAARSATEQKDGYGLYQLAYQEYVHNYTKSRLNPKTMLYWAFEIGKANADPYLMYWVTEFEGTVNFHFEYLARRRHHAAWTDSVATQQKETTVLYLLADLNDKAFKEMKELAAKYLQCAYLKDETYGLLPYDIRTKADSLARMAVQK